MTEQNEKKQKREIALISLTDPYYQMLGAVHYAKELGSEYGNILENLNQEAINNYPSKEAYKELFASRLLSGEAITDTSLQKDAFSILRGSFWDILVEDAHKLLGLEKPLKEEYSKKYVNELNDKEKAILVQAYFSNTADSLAQKSIAGRGNERKNKLEDILCERGENESNLKRAA
ncbi:hypothetical protein DRN73_04010 [Candidatus Pacearchaeota archaeon]|nr:MAG: hypothetical protein DRN73_04010 [Candidatus Pacearchaeota archaeon]